MVIYFIIASLASYNAILNLYNTSYNTVIMLLYHIQLYSYTVIPEERRRVERGGGRDDDDATSTSRDDEFDDDDDVDDASSSSPRTSSSPR